MELQIYNSEKHDRPNLWYVIFGLITSGIVAISIVSGNREWSLLLFFLLGWYFYFSVKNSSPTIMKITETGIQVDRKIFPRSNIIWFSAELDDQKQQIKNIVIVTENGHTIHTINDSKENLTKFVKQLNERIQYLRDFNQNSREKILRRLKM